MQNKQNLLKAGIALAAIAAFTAPSLPAEQDQQPSTESYIHGLVWNTKAAAPMNDWLLRLDVRAALPNGNQLSVPNPGFATLSDDFHDSLGSHITLRSATLNGVQLTIDGSITESKTPSLIGLPVPSKASPSAARSGDSPSPSGATPSPARDRLTSATS